MPIFKRKTGIFEKTRFRAKSPLRDVFPAGIEISSTALRVVQVSAAEKGCEIVKAGSAPLAEGVYPGSPVLKKLAGEFIADNKITGKVSCLLPADRFYSFTFTLPNIPPEEIYPSITWKLRQNLPGGMLLENVSFEYDCFPAGEDGPDKDMKILVFAAPKEIVLEQVSLFKDLSLELTAIEPKPHALLYPLLGSGKISPGETVLILQLGANSSSVVIVHSGRPVFTRSLSFCGNLLTEAIAAYYRFTREKAEAVKIEEGMDGGTCVAALLSHFENLIVSVEHIFKNFSHQIMKAPLMRFQRVVLCGGTAHLKGLDKSITERLAVPAEVFDAADVPGIIQKQENARQIKQCPAAFAGVLGLAAREIYGCD